MWRLGPPGPQGLRTAGTVSWRVPNPLWLVGWPSVCRVGWRSLWLVGRCPALHAAQAVASSVPPDLLCPPWLSGYELGAAGSAPQTKLRDAPLPLEQRLSLISEYFIDVPYLIDEFFG